MKILNENGFPGDDYENAKAKAMTIHEHREKYANALRAIRLLAKGTRKDAHELIIGIVDDALTEEDNPDAG